ncbi:MAG: CheR family methyltransferase, partial [Pseudohongiella sp.]|nr:CheR family methyltransferase [Pseudohongiella sp.]
DKKEHAAIAPSAPLQQIILHLQHHTRHDFSLYKSSTLLRRIERRMAIHALDTIELYSAFLANNTQEIDLLFKELLIGVTSFFRDDEVWNYLSSTTLPELLAHNVEQSSLRAWSVGCSTGEEAYSLAMIFREVIDRLPAYKTCNLQIFASDLSADAIASARRAQYPLNIEDQISPTRLARFFTRHTNYYQINQEIRDMVLFAQHDVVLNPPFTRLDLIVCRNLLIYFDAELQRRLLPLFHYSLRAHGILLLGSSETVGRLQHLFLPIQAKLRLYQRNHDVASPARSLPLQSFPPLSTLVKEHPMSNINPVSGAADNLQSAADHLLLQIYSPAAVVINADADIVYISGRTGKYLEPAAGKANWNFHAMVKDELRVPISAALKQAALKKTTIQLRRLSLSTEDHTQLVDVTIQPLQEPATLLGMTMIVFRGAADGVPALTSTLEKSKSNATGVDSESETLDAAAVEFGYKAIQLQYQDEIQALREETHNSREQLQSTNEELQSTNEELQSTNEELTTSKEEMQSMNEELQTINTELQTKLDDLALAQSDLQNTLNSIEIAILFLDQNLNVRRYTDRAAKIINLRESDLGRPLSDLTSTLQYPSLHEDALTTLNTLVFSEKEIETNDGRWFSVRIMPYRRLDNMIDGVVITLFDISTTKKLEAALRGQ